MADQEVHDRGLFDFAKKDEKKHKEEAAISHEFDGKKEEKPSLVQKLHRSGSSSSSSSDEEEGEDGEKKKKNKGLKQKLKEKISGDAKHEDTTVPVEKHEDVHHVPVHAEAVPVAETEDQKKGLLDKIKDKLPGHKTAEEGSAPPPIPPPVKSPTTHDGEGREKKGIFDKIKEKLPGHHSKTEEEKEKEKN